jgi:hypothetical protein
LCCAGTADCRAKSFKQQQAERYQPSTLQPHTQTPPHIISSSSIQTTLTSSTSSIYSLPQAAAAAAAQLA